MPERFGENHPDLVTILDSLGGLYADEGDHPKARAAYERGIGLAERSLGPDHPDLGQSWNNLGLVHLREGDPVGAKRAFETALRVLEPALGPAHPDVATTRHNLAGALMQLGSLDDAERECAAALAIRGAALGDRHPSTADGLLLRASLHERRGRIERALEDHRAALEVVREAFGPRHNRTAQAPCGAGPASPRARGRAGRAGGRPGSAFRRAPLHPRGSGDDRARPQQHRPCLPCRRTRATRPPATRAGPRDDQATAAGDQADLVTALVNVAAAALAAGFAARAEALLGEAIASGERRWPDGHLVTAAAYNNLAKLREKAGGTAEAGELYGRAVDILARTLGEAHPQTELVRANREEAAQR